jgi:hypothetical protein
MSSLWNEPLWSTDPDIGKHDYVIFIDLRNANIKDCEQSDELMHYFQFYKDYIIFKCTKCGFVLKFHAARNRPTPFPLPNWGPHCVGQQLRNVIDT